MNNKLDKYFEQSTLIFAVNSWKRQNRLFFQSAFLNFYFFYKILASIKKSKGVI